MKTDDRYNGIPSRSKFRDEVSTPHHIAELMISACGNTDKPGAILLDPTCGDGNLLVSALIKKFAQCETNDERLTAIASLYGVEIMQDNVDKCKKRLLELVPRKLKEQARLIFDSHIVCGNFMEPESIWFLNEDKIPIQGDGENNKETPDPDEILLSMMEFEREKFSARIEALEKEADWLAQKIKQLCDACCAGGGCNCCPIQAERVCSIAERKFTFSVEDWRKAAKEARV